MQILCVGSSLFCWVDKLCQDATHTVQRPSHHVSCFHEEDLEQHFFIWRILHDHVSYLDFISMMVWNAGLFQSVLQDSKYWFGQVFLFNVWMWLPILECCCAHFYYREFEQRSVNWPSRAFYFVYSCMSLPISAPCDPTQFTSLPWIQKEHWVILSQCTAGSILWPG